MTPQKCIQWKWIAFIFTLLYCELSAGVCSETACSYETSCCKLFMLRQTDHRADHTHVVWVNGHISLGLQSNTRWPVGLKGRSQQTFYCSVYSYVQYINIMWSTNMFFLNDQCLYWYLQSMVAKAGIIQFNNRSECLYYIIFAQNLLKTMLCKLYLCVCCLLCALVFRWMGWLISMLEHETMIEMVFCMWPFEMNSSAVLILWFVVDYQ